SLITLLSDTAYHSFIGEVEALNTTTIRRLTTSRRHQLPAIAHVTASKIAAGAASSVIALKLPVELSRVSSGFAFTALTLSGVKVSRASEPHSRLRRSPWSELPVRASPKQAAPADWKLAGQVVTDAEDQASRIDLA